MKPLDEIVREVTDVIESHEGVHGVVFCLRDEGGIQKAAVTSSLTKDETRMLLLQYLGQDAMSPAEPSP